MKQQYIGRKVAKGIVFTCFLIYAISLLYPFVWSFMVALKDPIEYMTGNRNGLPQQWLFSNFLDALTALTDAEGNTMLTMLFNSLWFTVGGVGGGMIVSTMVAYVVAKYKFPGRNAIYFVALVSMMIPIVGAMPSQFKVFSALGIIDTPMMLLSFAGGFGFNFLVLFGYFKSLPWSYVEAGLIDGASHFRCFLQLMLPQAVSVIGALSVVSAIGFWNDYNTPLLFLKSFPTLSAGLYMYQIINTRNLNYPLLFAGILISMIPILVLFICFQNSIMEISFAGGLKG